MIYSENTWAKYINKKASKILSAEIGWKRKRKPNEYMTETLKWKIIILSVFYSSRR